jgi:hypothetical protein
LAEAEARGEAEVQALAPRLNEPSHGDIRSAVLGFVAASAAMAKSVDKILAEAEDLPRGELWFISDEIREVEQNLNATAAKFSAFVADSI